MQNQSIERLQLLQQQRAEALLALPAAAETMDEAAFMQYAMTQAENLTGSQIAFIHFVDANEENIELVTWSKRTLESYCHAVYNRHYPVSQAGIWADAVRQHRAVVFNDYPAYAQKRGLPEGHAALQRLISLPVIEHGKVVMLCGIGNKAEDYSDVDVDTLQLIGNDIWRLIQLSRNRKQLERFSRIIERSHSEVFTFDANTLLFVDANASAQKNLGYTQDELRTMTPLSIKPEMTPAGFERLLAPLRDGTQDMVRFTTLHRRKNGTSYIADIQLELHREANPIFIAMARDITERRQAEQSLRDALQIVEASSIVHFRIDAKDQLPVTYVSTTSNIGAIRRRIFTPGNTLSWIWCTPRISRSLSKRWRNLTPDSIQSRSNTGSLPVTGVPSGWKIEPGSSVTRILQPPCTTNASSATTMPKSVMNSI